MSSIHDMLILNAQPLGTVEQSFGNANTRRFCGSVPICRVVFFLLKSPRPDWGGNEPPSFLRLVLILSISRR